jgi:hypothetical protein
MMPSRWEAPLSLLGLPGNCGPMSLWLVLRHFGKRVGVARMIRACRHTQRTGCFGIALALALHQFGLRVRFHTDPDPNIQPLEARCYAWAERRGIPVEPALELEELRCLVRRGPAIVYLAGTEGEAHFSRLVGFRRGQALLPNTDEGRLSVPEFERRWHASGYPRQCMLVSA